MRQGEGASASPVLLAMNQSLPLAPRRHDQIVLARACDRRLRDPDLRSENDGSRDDPDRGRHRTVGRSV